MSKKQKALANLKNDNMLIPSFSDFNHFFHYQYSVAQLKDILKHYKLKLSGNKKDQQERIFHFLRNSFFVVKIQKVFRGFLQRQIFLLSGPALKNRKLCVNDSDFVTMDPLEEIPLNQFFSFQDADGFVYGFDVVSLTQLIQQNNSIKAVENPYNRNKISQQVIKNIRNIVCFNNALNKPINLDIEPPSLDLPFETRVEMRAVELFQLINSYGHYSDAQWFLRLPRERLIRYMFELADIWNYRGNLPNDIKISICPPDGNPFRNTNQIMRATTDWEMKNFFLDSLERMIKNGVNAEMRNLGAFYVLGSLTLVSNEASIGLPWLFQSFI